MLVLAVFPGAGHIETSVHNILSYCQVTQEAAGGEWFACSQQTAFAATGQALGAANSAASSAEAAAAQTANACKRHTTAALWPASPRNR